MNPPEPHDGLSAFFDGELSPAEDGEIANHLQHSPAAQNELTEIRQLSDEIRRLPAEPAPQNLLANVMAHIDGQATKADSEVAAHGGRSVSVWKAGSWVAIAAALAVLIAWIPSLWKPPETESSLDAVASNSQHPEAEEIAALEFEDSTNTQPARVILPSEAELMADSRDRQTPAEENFAPAGNQPQITAAADALQLQPEALRALGDRLSRSDKSPESQVVEFFNRADRDEGQVLIVEITAADPRAAMKDLQNLLAANRVAPANFELAAVAELESSGGRQNPAAAAADGLYVQSSSQQIHATLATLRQRRPESEIRAKSTLALHRIPLSDAEGSPGPQSKREARGFGNSLAQSIKEFESRREAGAKEAQLRKMERDIAKAKKAIGESQPADEPARLSPPQLTRMTLPSAPANAAEESKDAESFQMIVRGEVAQWLHPPAVPGEAKAESVESPPASPTATEEPGKKDQPHSVRVLFVVRSPS